MVTFQFVPYQEIDGLSSVKRVNKLINIVKQNKIVLLEGRLKKEEETDLIEITMEAVTDRFKGIELAVVYPEKNKMDAGERLRFGLAQLLLGDRQGFTIIGPASIVKRIKQNPDRRPYQLSLGQDANEERLAQTGHAFEKTVAACDEEGNDDAANDALNAAIRRRAAYSTRSPGPGRWAWYAAAWGWTSSAWN